MTELRIYPEKNLVVLSHQVTDEYDPLLDVVSLSSDRWRDDEWEYGKYPLDKFMDFISRCSSEK